LKPERPELVSDARRRYRSGRFASKFKLRANLRIAITLLGTALLLAATAPALAARPGAETGSLFTLPELGHGNVARVTDGASLILSDGTALRLAGVEPPLAAPGGNPQWEDAARTLLDSLVAGHGVTLRGTESAPDRYGRITVQLVRDDGVWIEGALVDAGVVRVQPPAPGLVAPLLQRESRARDGHLGLWQSPLYAVRTPEQLDHDSGSFVLVEALIGRVEDRSGVLWLDLGGNAAARLDRPARHLFAAAGLDPASLTGQHLRLRGWVRWQGRPVLDLTAPDCVETLPAPRRRRKSS
jgi:micrococcal nuclease